MSRYVSVFRLCLIGTEKLLFVAHKESIEDCPFCPQKSPLSLDLFVYRNHVLVDVLWSIETKTFCSVFVGAV